MQERDYSQLSQEEALRRVRDILVKLGEDNRRFMKKMHKKNNRVRRTPTRRSATARYSESPIFINEYEIRDDSLTIRNEYSPLYRSLSL